MGKEGFQRRAGLQDGNEREVDLIPIMSPRPRLRIVDRVFGGRTLQFGHLPRLRMLPIWALKTTGT